MDSSEVVATPKGVLVLKRAGALTDIRFEFTPPALVGRFDPTVGPIDIDLGIIDEGSYVSRKHARITHSEDGWAIEDLGSSNGTYILRDDFERIEQSGLVPGEELAFGNARFLFEEATTETEEPQIPEESEALESDVSEA